jgi:hypothetical protein
MLRPIAQTLLGLMSVPANLATSAMATSSVAISTNALLAPRFAANLPTALIQSGRIRVHAMKGLSATALTAMTWMSAPTARLGVAPTPYAKIRQAATSAPAKMCVVRRSWYHNRAHVYHSLLAIYAALDASKLNVRRKLPQMYISQV